MDDIERSLTAAADALREHDMVTRRCADLRGRVSELNGQVSALTAGLAAEQRDVDRLEHVSITRVLASLRGARDDALARERAEADAARYRLAETRSLLDAVEGERTAAEARLSQLRAAPGDYAAALAEKERFLATSEDPRGRRLLELAAERGHLEAEMREVSQAIRAARAADEALVTVQSLLNSASGWSTYDTFFGGGAMSSAIKHGRMDEAAQAAREADRCLAILRTELADVPGLGITAPQLAMDGLTRFVDVWFDNIFTDLAVRDRIRQAQDNVERARKLVGQVGGGLNQRSSAAGSRLAAIEAERIGVLTG